MSDSDPDCARSSCSRILTPLTLTCVFLAWLVTLCVVGHVEIERLRAAAESPAGLPGWFTQWNLDTPLTFLVLCGLPVLFIIAVLHHPVAVIISRFRTALAGQNRATKEASVSRGRQLSVAAGLFLLSLSCSAGIGMRPVKFSRTPAAPQLPLVMRFSDLPPAYHDEFSYLLQARTFLAGRVAWPGMQVRPDLFHQIHVLNEPTTASRYFPWTGMWMAPFVNRDIPYLGHWLAGAIACVCFHRCLIRLLPFRWALIGGLLIAISPGLAVFSNLLLAHHPTMLALSVFLWSFLRLMDSGRVSDAMISGIALTLAMLARPVTAGGFALPFGIWLIWQLVRSERQSKSDEFRIDFRLRLIPAFGFPLIAGFCVLAFMNQQITGEWTRSAYQYYTDTWTPRHRFGFNNAEIGSQLAGPKVLQAYDRWATNLTPKKAAENVSNRIIASSQWTLGIGALVFGLISAVPQVLPRRGADVRVPLLLCSVVSLHAVHIPYWYDGILHWHYVFETAPLLLMLVTFGLKNAADCFRPLGIPRLTSTWLSLVVLASLLPSWLDAESFWGASRVSLAVGEQTFSRARFEQFNRLTHSPLVSRPCLVMVDESTADPQLSYIINPPDLNSDVLVCRRPASASEVSELHKAFPDRTMYVFDPNTFQLTLTDPDGDIAR